MLRGRAGQRGAHRGDQRVHRGRVSLDDLASPSCGEAPGAIRLVGHHGIRHQHGARPRAQQRGAGVVAGAADRERAAGEGGRRIRSEAADANGPRSTAAAVEVGAGGEAAGEDDEPHRPDRALAGEAREGRDGGEQERPRPAPPPQLSTAYGGGGSATRCGGARR